MLSFPKSTQYEQKCDVTHGTMGHVDPKQPPTKRKPFAGILSHSFIHKIDLLLPQELFEIVEREILGDEITAQPRYSRVVIPLLGLLTGDFFIEYIKKGNILMLSEGRVGVDNVFMLKEGILTLHLDKESYERAGIVGKPYGVKGGRGTKPRWVVEINLRLPSMLHGKKGFERIIYAFKKVLNDPITWLFYDSGITASSLDPLELHHPIRKHISPQVVKDIMVELPALRPPSERDPLYGLEFDDYATETHEWLSLTLLESPRLDPNDEIDPFLSRYAPPGETKPQPLIKITWQGFISPSWAHQHFVKALLALPKDHWFAYSISEFSKGWESVGQNSLILKLPESSSDYVLWNVT